LAIASYHAALESQLEGASAIHSLHLRARHQIQAAGAHAAAVRHLWPQPVSREFGRENDRRAIPAFTPQVDGISAVDQATQLRDAIQLAYCQPAVSGFLNFGLLDEERLGGWQSGLLWRDGTRKPSYETLKAAIAEARRRDTDCSKVRGAPTG
jgi:hypothetical protein